ncbi:hypothetical protein LTR72_010213 [Exophiala xenobiotica]|nr:hypothetical protein LTR72_010213 [Exophiala xenobiotica]KAK5286905.1 hypothetical protein LTR14_009650 [Exophiala xenobiotica]KAK5478109.1 hypothetical protein LTR55_008093 [Exophiala xenobiotica]
MQCSGVGGNSIYKYLETFPGKTRMLLLTLASLLLAFAYLLKAQDPVRPYPLPDSFLPTTSILNHSSYLEGFDEPQWYLDNIPFVDFPDPGIQQIYYYRTSVLKRHLVYAHQGHGWVITEFIQPVPWASKFQSIPDSAPHQILEARWLRDPSYVNDVTQLYTRGGLESIAGVTYTHYLQDSFMEAAQATGNMAFLQAQLDGMINMYDLWNTTKDQTTGLYHRTPLLDAQEFSLPGYVIGGPEGGSVDVWNSFQNNYSIIWLGPETYRPSFNTYMVSNARAISTVAELSGNASLASAWNATTNQLLQTMQNTLWDHDIQFWIDVVQGTNLPIVGRQLIGLYPYRFDIGTEDMYIPGIENSLNEHGFISEFGPTTLEQSNPYFTAEKNITYCCMWNGQSWPFSTCVYLGTLARLARDNRSTVATPEFFQEAFQTYTRTHYDHGEPAIFESHYPTRDAWSGYTRNHSEHYLHSTYMDNVFTNLLGIFPSFSDTFEMAPLVPSNWTNFAVENLPYHGNLLSILWDANGTAYSNFNHSSGLSIYANGALLYNQPTLARFSVALPNSSNSSIAQLSSANRYVNILSNPNSLVASTSLPYANATDTFFVLGNNLGPADSAYKANDGLVFYDNPPDNFYSNNQTYNPASWLNFTLPRARNFSSVTIAVYDDSQRGGALACPAGLYVYVSNTTATAGNGLNTSTKASSQDRLVAQRTPWSSCQPNARNTISFNASVTADTLSLYLVNAIHYAVGIVEVEIWVPANSGPRYEAEDGLIGFFSQGGSIGTNGTVVNGGVQLAGQGDDRGILEIADVRTQSPAGDAGRASLTILGYGGNVTVGLNYLQNVTFAMPATRGRNVSVAMDFLVGGNVVTIYQDTDQPVWIDAIVVS